ncbi:MAG: HAMP domain-containing histidine kinase [Pirellulales bacterium]|nr:HAMP domain-containing histidine kinase [Pirellulales bacterium]
MSTRRSLRLPIILAIVMIVLLVVLTVGWVLLAVSKAVSDTGYAPLYWTLLTVGTTFILLLLVGVVLYLVLSIKAINLSRRQSNFIDSVTHELKSPIASMKLYLQTLNRRRVSESQQAGFYRFMLEDVERLDHLINQMLDAGRMESGRADGEIEDVPLAPLLRECAEAVCLSYRVPPETIAVDAEPLIVRARPGDLEMVFRNLLDNAVKYAGAPPRVEVTLRPGPEGCTVARIADNGRGIPQKLRRKIFGRFVRLGLELEREKPGTGLGLYIVRTLVKRLRGRIRVRDREQGPGTVFEVQLPGCLQGPPTDGNPAEGAEAPPPAEPETTKS